MKRYNVVHTGYGKIMYEEPKATRRSVRIVLGIWIAEFILVAGAILVFLEVL